MLIFWCSSKESEAAVRRMFFKVGVLIHRKTDSNTSVFLWILKTFLRTAFFRTPLAAASEELDKVL